jgi:hypothetical protein
VEQLAAKADMKARARDKASQVTGRLKGKAGQARQQAAAAAAKISKVTRNRFSVAPPKRPSSPGSGGCR